MSGLELAFLAMTIIGAGFVFFTLVVGEIADVFGGDAGDTGGDGHDVDGPGWASPTVLAGAITGYGLTGFVATRSGLSPFWALLLGALVAFGVGFLMISILRALYRQQGNSGVSGATFEGINAVVTLSIPPGAMGQVQFRDKNGVLVTRSAASTWSEEMPAGTEVIVKRVLADHVVVSRT